MLFYFLARLLSSKRHIFRVCGGLVYKLAGILKQIVGSISAVSASLFIGKAGPMVHTGACIASLLGQGGSTKYRLNWKWLRYFKNDRDRRDLVTCGSAAGIAAAFRAPVGGLLFALEEMASWYVLLTVFCLFCCDLFDREA